MATPRASANNTSATNSVTVSAPAGVQTDDLLIALVGVAAGSATNTLTTPTGWTPYILPTPPSSSYPQFGVFFRIATASEASSYTFGQSVNNPGMAAVVAAYSGVNVLCPFLTGQPLQSSAASTALATNLVAAHAAKASTAVSLAVSSTITAPSATTWAVRQSPSRTGILAVLADEAVAIHTATTGSVTGGSGFVMSISLMLNPNGAPVITRANAIDEDGNTAASPGGAVNIVLQSSTSQTACVGSLVLAVVGWQNDPGTVTTPSGWTLVATRAPTGGYPHLLVFARVLDYTDMVKFSFLGQISVTSNAFGNVCQPVVIGSVFPTSPVQNVVGNDYKQVATWGWPATATVDTDGLAIAVTCINANGVGAVDSRLTLVIQQAQFASNGVYLAVYRQFLGAIGAAPAYTHTGVGTTPDNDNGSDVAFTVASASIVGTISRTPRLGLIPAA